MVPGRGYTVQFAGAVPLRPRIYLNRTVAGEWARLTLPYPQATFRVIRDYNSSSPGCGGVSRSSTPARATYLRLRDR